jgi:Fur family zinc uptake transcriptional regulator
LDVVELDQPAAFGLERCGAPEPNWPGMRTAILCELGASLTPLSAYEITDRLSLRYGRKRHANSVYRALRTLISSNDITLIESWRKFTPMTKAQAGCAWLLCERCETVKPVAMSETVGALARLASGHSFTATKIVLEIRGTCASCHAG